MLFRSLWWVAVAVVAAVPVAQAAEIKAWVQAPADYPQHQGLQYFLERLKANSFNQFSGKLICCDQQTDSAAAARLKRGEIDVALLGVTPLAEAVPEVGVLSLPFLFRDTEHMMQVLEGKIGKQLQQQLEFKGYMVLAWYDGGARSFYARKGLLQYTSDFAGQKIALPKADDYVRMAQALGGHPVPMAADKVNEALQSGAADVAESDLVTYSLSEHYKVAPYFTFTQHIFQPLALVVSPQWWGKLSEADRSTLRQTANEAAVRSRWTAAGRESELKTRLQKAGVKFGDFKSSATVIAGMKEAYAPVLSNQKAIDVMFGIMSTTQK